MISMKTVVKVFVFALFVGIIPANVAAQNSESNVLQSQGQIEEEQDLVETDEQVSYGDFDKVSGNSLDPDAFNNIGDDDDDDDDF